MLSGAGAMAVPSMELDEPPSQMTSLAPLRRSDVTVRHATQSRLSIRCGRHLKRCMALASSRQSYWPNSYHLHTVLNLRTRPGRHLNQLHSPNAGAPRAATLRFSRCATNPAPCLPTLTAKRTRVRNIFELEDSFRY